MELCVGQRAELTRVISDEDVRLFARLTGDDNPIHLDEAAGRASRFGGRIAHGMLVGSLISTAIGMHLPGPGTVYLTQALKFTRPVRIGDTVTVLVEVLEIIAAKGRARLATTCRNQDGDMVLDGEALVMVPDGTTFAT